MVPRVGQRIGPYEILGRLGSGGMGLVFSAWDVRLQRDVAIKLLREEFLTPGMRSRFLQEARAASRLNHPNICTIFDIGEHQGDPYLVMELLKGETVRSRIARGPLSPESILTVAIEVADALAVAHAQGVVHRDIKPANIILVEKPGGFQSKVLDFGLAKIETSVPGDSRFDHTHAGTTVGTVSYMSPEQARGEPLDARSDLFSLGVVLYEMSTGLLPFQGATSALIFVQILSHRPDPVREFNGEVPKSLERIVAKLLEKGRDDRFQSAQETLEALHRARAGKTGAVQSFWGRKRRAFAALLPESAVAAPHAAAATSAAITNGADSTPTPTPRSKGGESVLRPVKRIVTGDRSRVSSWPDASRAGLSSAAGPESTRSEPAGSKASRTESSGPSAPVRAVQAASSGQRAAGPEEPVVKGREPEGRASEAKISETRTPPGSSPGAKAMSRRPARHFELVEMDDDGRPVRRDGEKATSASGAGGARWMAVAAIALLGLAAVVAVAAYFAAHRHPAAPHAVTALVVGPVTDRTGDSTLGDTIAAGLRLDLEQSPQLSIRSAEDFAAGLQFIGAPVLGTLGGQPPLNVARRAAKATGASVLVLGSLRNDNSSYVITLDATDVATGKRLAEATETAGSRKQILDAIDGLASNLRLGLGEAGDSVGRTSEPLSREATASLDALDAYASGDSLAAQGSLVDAMFAYQRATTLDPHFTQALLRLAGMYRRQQAEVSAERAASQAAGAASSAGERMRLLAEASYAIDVSGDYPHALDVLQQIERASLHPANGGDLRTLDEIALVQRLEGNYPDALRTTQSVLQRSPRDADAAEEAELAMLALDRDDAAAQLERQSARGGQPHPGIAMLMAYLSAAPANIAPPDVAAAPQDFGQWGLDESAASILDAQGELPAGLTVWNNVAYHASALPGLASASSYALGRAALDNALASDCPTARGLAQRAVTMVAGPDTLGPGTLYATGLASALCGDLDAAHKSLTDLLAGPAQAFAPRGIYIPELTAVLQWKAGNSAAALATLESAGQFDSISLAPYLRGLIHLSARQQELAIADFQEVLLHRGAMALVDPESCPLAQLELARAYAVDHDAANSAAAYAKFLNEWTNADLANPLVVEARAGSRERLP